MLPTAMQLGIYQSQHMKNANVAEHFFFWGGVGVKISLIIDMRRPPKQSWCTFLIVSLLSAVMRQSAKNSRQKKWDRSNFTKRADLN